jgi:hypothetical protein
MKNKIAISSIIFTSLILTACGSPHSASNRAPQAVGVSITDNNGGDALVGDSLTGNYTYFDVESDTEGTSTFRWLRDGVAISGATTSTYTLVAADSGANISFEVTPVATTGTKTGVAVTSKSVVVINSPPMASNVSITDTNGGSPIIGDSLTGSYTYSDVDGDVEGATTVRWLRDGVAISGATSSTYTLVLADHDASITFEVTPVAATGTTTGNPATSSGMTVKNSAPVASAVSITDNNGGSAVVGDSLTGNYTYSDVDGDSEGASQFHWLRNGYLISGAIYSTYTLVAADSGANITFVVTPIASTGTLVGSPSISSPLAASNSAPTASAVSITDDNGGSVVVGDSLTGHYTYFDIDGDAEGISTFRWLRNGVAIPGATSSTYTLVAADSGAPITFEVTPVAATGTTPGNPATSSGVTVINSAPTASAVSITDNTSSNFAVGDQLTGNYTYSDVDGDVEGATTVRWLRDGVPITGATSVNYTLVAADSGTNIKITFEVTPVSATGNPSTGSTVTSGAVIVTNSAPTASAVGITDDNGGTIIVGVNLTGNYTYNDVDGDLEGTSTFRWLRDGVAISGATSNTYTLVAADSGATITFEVTPVAATGTTTGIAVTSSLLSVVNSAPTASAVGITDDNGGTIIVGVNLTGNYTYSDVDGDAEGTSTFRWLRDGAAIPGATSTTYTLVAADSGTTITFEVTPVAVTGTLTGTPVTSTGVPVNNSAPTASAVSISGNNVVGAILTGNYSYSDVDGDLEGTSTFRWLRDGVAISGATNQSYTLVSADSGASITFEVTPVAASGTITGTAVTSNAVVPGTPPLVSGVARYLDINTNGVVDAGDQLIVPFDQDVVVSGAVGSDFVIPGGSVGSGATVSAGSASNEVKITLGTSPSINVRLAYSGTPYTCSTGSWASDLPSFIDVSCSMSPGAIVGLTTGIDAAFSVPIDITPAYVDSGLSLGPFDAQSMATGDVNGDGYPDIVIANSSNGVNGAGNRVLINNGSGGFADSGQSLGTGNSQSVALGDVDGDGDLDMVVANSNGEANTVWLNDGSGNFTDSGQSLGSSSSTSVALGDVDRDGDLDIVVANDGGGQGNTVWFNDGLGHFSDSGQSLGSSSSTSVALGDVDRDGDLDMVVANTNGEANTVWLNDGTGYFTDSGQSLGSSSSTSVALGDVDKDGDLDMVVANTNGEANTVWFNDGSGNFTDSGQSLGSSSSTSVALGDMDGDGDLDMVVANYGEGNKVWLNNGTGTFTDSGQSMGSGSSTSVALGDVNKDGGLDMMVANFGQSPQVYFNSLSGAWGSGSFVASTTTMPNLTYCGDSVKFGDVDGDGDLDMVIANYCQGDRVYLNDGSGNYTDSGQTLDPSSSVSVALGDVDGDGDLDMVVANDNSEANTVWLNDGAGTFTDTGQALGLNSSMSVALGDVDKDGDLDMVVATNNGGNTVWLNDGTGTFTDSGQSLGTRASFSVALGDVDGDGDLDMVVANNGGGQVNRVWLNDGAGTFTNSGQSLGSGSSTSVALGDVDGDGDLDMVVANTSSEANTVWFNDGSGKFTDSGQSLGSSSSSSVTLGDVDGDGDLDMVVANDGGGQANTVWLNDGSGTFTDSGQTLGSSQSRGIALGDVDGDGDLDMAVANFQEINTLYLNQ